ncbi:nSTAND3 domain-containing NTPase [Mucilaginibacter sp. HD30]
MYDFSTLNSSDLEDLVCDLLNEINKAERNGIFYHTYKDGKDKGIDFRYSTDTNENWIVGQVKHYLKSGIDLLLSDLEKKEKNKVANLKPDRYIFATSVDLAVGDVDKIVAIFTPFLKKNGDVYGTKDLNQLLGTYKDVIDRHFKLWYSSSEVLKKIVHYEIFGRALEFTEDYLKRKLNLYVKTPLFDQARRHLLNKKLVVITGDPGCGKTTLAELLVYEFIKDDYELTYLIDDIRDAGKAIRNDDSKQIFYFDDFLGHNAAEIERSKGADSALLMVMNKILRLNNKFIIFTTRSSIFASALVQSQKLKDFNLDGFKNPIHLSAYTDDIKRQILLNHIEYADITEDLKDMLRETSIQNFIVAHPNFNPRSIEYIITPHRIAGLDEAQYRNFIINNFGNPDDIWHHAYFEQIGEAERLLLNTMYSLGDSISRDELEEAFDSRIAYEVEYHNFQKKMFAFERTFKNLLDSYIFPQNNPSNIVRYRFDSPSLVDFLNGVIFQNRDEIKRIIGAAVSLEQISKRFLHLLDKDGDPKLIESIKAKLLQFNSNPELEDADRIDLVFLLYNYVENSAVVDLMIENLKTIQDFIEPADDPAALAKLKLFLEHQSEPRLIKAISEIGTKIFIPIIDDEYTLEDIIKVCQMIKNKYAVDPSGLLLRESQDFKNRIEEQFFQEMENDLEDLKGYITGEDELDEMKRKYIDYAMHLEEFGIKITWFENSFDIKDWFEAISHNQFRHSYNNDKDT